MKRQLAQANRQIKDLKQQLSIYTTQPLVNNTRKLERYLPDFNVEEAQFSVDYNQDEIGKSLDSEGINAA